MPASKIVRACVGFLVVLAPGRTEAAGFSVARFASEHGHPTTDNATAIYYNPAALASTRETRGFADLTLAFRHATYTRGPTPEDAVAPPGAESANSGRAVLGNVLVGPALALSLPVGPFTLGVGWFTPFGAAVTWPRRSEFERHPRLPGPADGVQRWHSIEGHLFTSALSAAAAGTFLDGRLSLGLALNLLGSTISDVRARGDGTNDVEREGRALLEASGLAFSLGAGVLFEVLPEKLWLGASYQSRPNLHGGMDLRGTAQGNLGTTTRADVVVSYDLPDVYRLGARYRAARWVELRLFGDYTRWSAFENQCIRFAGGSCRLGGDGASLPGSAVVQNLPRNFEDSAGIRFGWSVFLGREHEVFSGFGYETRAVPDGTLEASLPDFSSFSFAVGFRTEIAPRVRLATSITELLFVPRTVKSELDEYAVPSKQPDASGRYTQYIAALNVNAEFSF